MILKVVLALTSSLLIKMLPRRSRVARYCVFGVILSSILFIWIVGPSHFDTFHPLNETLVHMEFGELLQKTNMTFSSENKSVQEIYQYVQIMRQKLPVNPHSFSFILKPMDICSHENIFLLTYVHSAPEHFKRRTLIRQTWGNLKNFPEGTFRIVFLVGYPKDRKVQEALEFESDAHGDIVEEDFIDSYRNLTYKAIMGLRWTSNYCKKARLILKTDDDIFVNIFNVYNHFWSLHKSQSPFEKSVFCLVWHRMKVVRNPQSKWYLSVDEFKDDYFPQYCSGSAYMFTNDLIPLMYEASFSTPFFWVDDYYVTGMLAEKAGAKYVMLNSLYSLFPSDFLAKFTGDSNRLLTFGHVHDLNQWHFVWKRVVEQWRNSTLR